MLTARVEERDKLLGFEIGADDYITKPFSMRELLARVNAHLRRVAAFETSEEEIFDDGDLHVDRARFEVRLKGERVHLTKKEFDLLWLLIRSRNRVVTRDAILARLWDYDADVETRTVDVHIRALRRKLGDQRIETVVGLGYRYREAAEIEPRQTLRMRLRSRFTVLFAVLAARGRVLPRLGVGRDALAAPWRTASPTGSRARSGRISRTTWCAADRPPRTATRSCEGAGAARVPRDLHRAGRPRPGRLGPAAGRRARDGEPRESPRGPGGARARARAARSGSRRRSSGAMLYVARTLPDGSVLRLAVSEARLREVEQSLPVDGCARRSSSPACSVPDRRERLAPLLRADRGAHRARPRPSRPETSRATCRAPAARRCSSWAGRSGG